jgi:hypothetical protein
VRGDVRAQIDEFCDAIAVESGVPLPEALFADNRLELKHLESGTRFVFSAEGAMRSWNQRQVRIAHEAVATASGMSEGDIPVHDGLVGPTSFDWTYQNEYDGESEEGCTFSENSEGLPMELLRARDDILWHCSLPLYEDDLHDMGVSAMAPAVACALTGDVRRLWRRASRPGSCPDASSC